MLYRYIKVEQVTQGTNGLFNSFHFQITFRFHLEHLFYICFMNTRWAQMENAALLVAPAEAY